MTRLLPALLVLVVCLPIALPLAGVDWFESHEGASYPARVVEVGRCWDDGMWSARWFPDLAGGKGYPFLSFYAPLSFWVAAALHRTGLPVPIALKLVIVLATALGAAGAWRLARLGLDRSGAFLAAVFFAWAPYSLRDLWTRGDLAEYLALGFLPWVLWGMLRLGRRTGTGAPILAAALGAGAILSHNVVGLFTGLAMAGTAIGIVIASEPSRRPATAARAVLAGALALGASAFFWVPALFEKKWVQLENLRRGYFDVHQHFVSFGDLLGLVRPARVFEPGRAEPMTFELGLALLALPALPFAWRVRGARPVVVLGAALLVVGGVLSHRISSPAYDAIALLRFVGLPWRFLSLASLGLALLAAAGAAGVLAAFGPRARTIGTAIVALLAAASVADLSRPLAELELADWMLDPAAYREAGFTASVADEYTPIWARAEENVPFRQGLAATGEARFDDVERGVARWSFGVEAATEVTIVLQDWFYPGWTCRRNGEETEIEPRPGSGHAQLRCPAGTHRVEARLEPLPVRRAARWISAATILGTLLIVAIRRST